MSAERFHFGVAWLALTFAFALHVADEAATDILSVYNPTVLAIRARVPFFPMPTFTFGVWLAGLIIAVSVMLALSFVAFRQSARLRYVAYPYAVIMLLNGLGHIGGSIYMKRLMPGVFSSPFLLAASIWLLIATRRVTINSKEATHG